MYESGEKMLYSVVLDLIDVVPTGDLIKWSDTIVALELASKSVIFHQKLEENEPIFDQRTGRGSEQTGANQSNACAQREGGGTPD